MYFCNLFSYFVQTGNDRICGEAYLLFGVFLVKSCNYAVYMGKVIRAVFKHAAQGGVGAVIAFLQHSVNAVAGYDKGCFCTGFIGEKQLNDLVVKIAVLKGLPIIVKINTYNIVQLVLHQRVHGNIIHQPAVKEIIVFYLYGAVEYG